jgi:hypothetical protein
MSLTENEMNEYLKMKEQQKKLNKYHNEYNKKNIQTKKETDQETYKILMERQNEANKKYKKSALEKLKQDPIKYEEYRLKQNKYKNEWNNKKKEATNKNISNDNNLIIV